MAVKRTQPRSRIVYHSIATYALSMTICVSSYTQI
jgi:hypothetical protein